MNLPSLLQALIVEAISDAVADGGQDLRDAMRQHQGFKDIGKRMLLAWSESIKGLRDKRIYAFGEWQPGANFEGFSAPSKGKVKPSKIG